MTMEQYLNARYRNDYSSREKEMYTVTLNKNVADWNTSFNLQYSRQTYWDILGHTENGLLYGERQPLL